MSDTLAYRERLGVPLRWWVQGTMFVASLWLALIVAVPPSLAWVVTAVAMALLSAGLVSYGAPRIEVAGTTLRVGRAHIATTHLGGVEALDADQTRRAAGVDADHRAYLVLRPYLKRAVRIAVTDPADPAPYWLVSTRHPERLAVTLGALTRTSGASAPEDR